ncbi:MAG: hypothetical protein WC657_04185 [Candidatus Paceibacterota bacterium]
MKKTVLEPKYWQMSLGFPLARLLNRVVSNCGFAEKVEVVSFPSKECFRVLVFLLDPLGEPIHRGTGKRGIEFMRIEIRFPDRFNMILVNASGGGFGFAFSSPTVLAVKSEKALTEILCTLWVETNP